MNRDDQKLLLTTFIDQVKDELLRRSIYWPDNWDGHELRELVNYAFEFERTSLMREERARRKDCHNDILVNNLY